MNCSNCGTTFRADDLLCRLCGREKADEMLPASAEEAPVVGAGVDQEFVLPGAEASAPDKVWLEPSPRPKPSGKWYPSATPRIVMTAVLSAVAMAGIFHLVSRLFNLFIIFPLIQGGIVGAIVASAIKKGKCRSTKVAAGFGLAAGLLSYGSGMVFDTMRLRPQIVQAVSEELVEQSQMKPEEARREVERQLDPLTSFRFAQELQAESGVTLSRYSSSSGSPIRGWGYWGIVLLEVCCLTGVCTVLTWGAAGERFCERCDDWYTSITPYKCGAQWSEQMVHSVRGADWEAVATLAGQGDVKEDNKCEVLFHSCPKCRERQVEIKATVGKKTTELFHGAVPDEAGEWLVSPFKPSA